MKKWINIGTNIEYDWYEIRCEIEENNRLKVYLDGLRNKKLKFCIDFGKILLYKAVDEGWELNPVTESQESPLISDAIFVEWIEGELIESMQQYYFSPFYHYQVNGINFGVDVIAIEPAKVFIL